MYTYVLFTFSDVTTGQSEPTKSTYEQPTARAIGSNKYDVNGGEREPSRSSDGSSADTAAAVSTATTAAGCASVTTQTEPIVQSSPKLQSIQHTHSASTASSNASSTTTTKSTKSSSGSSKPQIKFSPDIEQYFEDNGPSTSSTKHGHKRKDRKHKR